MAFIWNFHFLPQKLTSKKKNLCSRKLEYCPSENVSKNSNNLSYYPHTTPSTHEITFTFPFNCTRTFFRDCQMSVSDLTGWELSFTNGPYSKYQTQAVHCFAYTSYQLSINYNSQNPNWEHIHLLKSLIELGEIFSSINLLWRIPMSIQIEETRGTNCGRRDKKRLCIFSVYYLLRAPLCSNTWKPSTAFL